MINTNSQSSELKALSLEYPDSALRETTQEWKQDAPLPAPCSPLLANGHLCFSQRDMGAVLFPGRMGREGSVRLYYLV